MTIQTTKTVTTEREIKLPYFFKRTYSSIKPDYYAIFSEDKAMVVYPNANAINCCLPDYISDKINESDISECPEEEFTEAFETTMNHIQSMIPVTK
jgi:hypothetical protein